MSTADPAAATTVPATITATTINTTTTTDTNITTTITVLPGSSILSNLACRCSAGRPTQRPATTTDTVCYCRRGGPVPRVKETQSFERFGVSLGQLGL